mgnify:CR=1 FL=1
MVAYPEGLVVYGGFGAEALDGFVGVCRLWVVALGVCMMDDGLGEGVCAELFDGAGVDEEFGFTVAVEGDDALDGGLTCGEGTCLVHGEGGDICRVLEVDAAFDEDAGSGSAGKSCDDADGGGNNEGTGACDEEEDEGVVDGFL